jgi:hypothetical protein
MSEHPLGSAAPATGFTPRGFATAVGVIGCALVVLGIAQSAIVVSQTGSIDLRNRVVAARQAERGFNPYFFKWTPAYPETLLDARDDPGARFTRLTSPPSTVWFHSLFARFAYRWQKWTNFALAWLALVAIAWWATRSLALPVPAVLFATGAYAVSGPWQLHIERGQQYVYLALLLLLAVCPPYGVLGPWFRALAALFRPTLGIAIFTAFRERRIQRSVLVTIGAGGLLALPILIAYPISWWYDYLASARDWYLHILGLHAVITSSGPVASLVYPVAPEGDPTMTNAWLFTTSGSGLVHFARTLGWMPPFEWATGVSVALTVIAGIVLWRARGERLASFAARFFGAVYLADFASPTPRGVYNAVLFFPAILLAVAELFRSGPADSLRRSIGWDRLWATLVSAGLCVSLIGIVRPDATTVVVEIAFVCGAAVAVFRPIVSSPEP